TPVRAPLAELEPWPDAGSLGPVPADHDGLAGHLGVDRQERSAGQFDDDLLAPPRDAFDPPAGDAVGELFGRDPAEGPRPVGRRVDDRRAGDQWSEIANDRFDFG